MAFVSRLRAEVAIAGGVSDTPETDRVQYERAPVSFDLRNLYFRDKLPKYTGALKIRGNCAGHGGVNDGDVVLYSKEPRIEAFEKGDVVVLKASKNYPGMNFENSWKCLRVFEGLEADGQIAVSSLSDDNTRQESQVPASALIGRGVYAFTL